MGSYSRFRNRWGSSGMMVIMRTTSRISFLQDGITYDAEDGQWLYDVCEAAGASVPFARKAGAYGTCATQIVEGEESLGAQRAREIRILESSARE